MTTRRITNRFCEAYLLVYSVTLAKDIYLFFSADSPQQTFYAILFCFHSALFFTYIGALIQILLNIVHTIGMGLYVYRIPLFKPALWRCLFIARILADLAGRRYESLELRAFFLSDPAVAGLALASAFLFYLPSCVMNYSYAFRWNKIFPAPQAADRE